MKFHIFFIVLAYLEVRFYLSKILSCHLNRQKKSFPGSFPEAFSTGYLLGELLHKYGLQDDFKQFSQNRGADAKINNFSRLEPTLHLLGVQFNENMAQDIMTRQHGAATKLLYELYIALEKKRKTTLTGVTVGAMRPAATAKHMSTEIAHQNETKSKMVTEKRSCVHVAEQLRAQNLQEQNSQDTEKRQSEIMARIQTGVIQIQKQPSRPTIKSLEDKRLLKKKREAENVYKEIEKFEKSMTGNFQEASLETITETRTELLSIYSDDEYLRKIQKHVQEDAFAREQRAKRRRKMLMDQLAAHDAQEKVYREEQLIYRLIKQSQHERRIATQLMHVRHEKEVIRLNRIFREKQYEERRQKEFQEALDREAALAKQEAIDNEEKITREKEHHEKIAAERAQACYKKHYSMCWEMIGQIIDISTKVVEYQQLTNNRVPLKLMLDWKELFFNGKPIYEQASIQPLSDEPSPEQLVELSKMSLLDEKDYGEYKSMTGEWSPTEENSENKPPLNNNILGHVLRRLMEMFYPPKPKSSREFPSFPVKGCILGKIFSGKTTCAKFIEKVCNIQVLSVGTLVQEAIEAFHNNEMKSESSIISQEAESSGEQDDVSIFSDFGIVGLCTFQLLFSMTVMDILSICCTLPQLSVRAQLGAASQKWLKNGESVPDELLVDILLEAITYEIIPPEKGWIVEGFPMTINQAKLFEKSYTGIDVEAKDPISEKLSLAIDPRAPNQPPPTSPAFDVSILLDISDSLVLKRAANVKYAEILEENIGFLKTWPKLEKWFSVRQNNLVKVNAETEESLVCETVKEIITEEIVKNQNRKIPPEEEEVLPATDEEEVLPVAEEEEALPVKDQPSPSSEAPPVIEPGSDEWIYVDEPLPQEIIDLLVPYWEMVENTYMNTIKTVLRCLRDEQYTIIHYAADIRKNFQGYLRRPHFMQEFVSQWQADFNSIADELQDDEETKAELHQRVTDLRDLLWDICNSRREEAERERTGIMNEEWLPDRRGIAMNHFFTLMQVELDRFQDTKRLLHDYYRAMEGKIPTEDNQDFTRLPLLDIINGQIPLVSLKLPPPGNTESEKSGTKKKSLKDNSSENRVTTCRDDKNLVIDTWRTAVTAVSDMVWNAATKSRLELIKEKALVFLEDLKFKAEEAYKDMEKWLGSTFLEEKSSVEKLVEVARHHIESSSKILYEMTLEGTDFFINSDVKMVPDPVPDPDPPPEFQRIETSGRSTLTISQLTTLHKQFLQLAPKGFISKKVFIETVSGLVNLNLGKYCYPDAWKNLTFADLENLASEFTVNSQLTDWRRFLLAAAQPWPVPSVTQLLQTLHVFKSVDVTGSGFVTQEHYLQVGLWFNGNEDLSITESCEEPVSLERLKHLIEFFFHLFADSKKDPALLDYIEMLLYFASHSDPVEGVYRALSIVTGAYIHRKKKASLPRDSSSPNIMSNEKTLIKDEKEVLNYTGEGIISVASLLKVFHSRGSKDEDYHRFSCLEKADNYFYLKHFIKVYQELGAEDLAPIAFELLLKHPFMEDLINTCQEYKLPVSIPVWDPRLCKHICLNLHCPRNVHVINADTANLQCRPDIQPSSCRVDQVFCFL
uniref:Sperm flagellar 2 n=1 Tax=Serinus canaria TaxID=9135 RepID=A0A8C9MXB0_SERCA